MGVVDLDPLRPWLTPGGVASEAPPSAGGEARATMWDGRPRPSDHRKRLGNWLNSRAPRRGVLKIGRRFSAGCRYSNTSKDPRRAGVKAWYYKNIFTCCYFPDSKSFAMPDTFARFGSIMFSARRTAKPWLVPAVRARLWPDFGAIAKQCDSTPKCIGGVSDHVHLLLSASKNFSTAELARRLKAGSRPSRTGPI